MMIAKFFDPSFAISMDEWSHITAFDKSTWASAGLLWFKEHGYTVKHITMFDFQKFSDTGSDYLIEIVGQEAAEWQINHSNVSAEIERAESLVASGIVERREPTLNDIREALDSYLVRPLINSHRLSNTPSYAGHAVVVFDCDEGGVYMHDPGPIPYENRYVT